ncbi:MAG: DUF423 domain-containing protein [Planctomycetes bacterium]|nr:DUF423 domain-containing protein [Planctomycetota bacterium]
MKRSLLQTSAVLAFLAVALGAFGAHALQDQVDAQGIETWQTAVRYHMWHALALGILSLCATTLTPSSLRWASRCFLAGIIVFSGSLYALVLTETKILGAITPLGGLAFLAGWLITFWGARQSTD